jgi:ParB family chromosome partitioning protein
MLTVHTKPLSFFRPDETQPRQSFDLEELYLLRDSLVKKQLVPLICRPCGTIIDGHRRFRAASLEGRPAQLETIIVEADITHAQVREIQLITALHRVDLKPYEMYCGFQEWLKAHPGATAKELAKAIDRSEAAVSLTLSLARCVPPVKEAAAAGKIGLKDWNTIGQVDPDQQLVMLQAKLSGTSAEGLKKLRKRPANAVRTARVKCPMGSGICVTLAAEGAGMTLDDVEEVLVALLREVRRGKDQGLDSKTFSAVLRDKAKAG